MKRPAKNLSSAMEHGLGMYALAASAAGVSLMALAQPAEARIIYTKLHQVIRTNGIYPLDLNHDGTIDFVIQEPYSLWVKSAFGNAVEGASSGLFASALQKGGSIGPQQRFKSNSGSFGEGMVLFACSYPCQTVSGPWVNVNNRYLGLKFQIDGKTHYGWARLSVRVQGSQITASLTGYAYETISNRGIRAGQTHGAVEDTTASLDPTAQKAPASVAINPTGRKAQAGSLGRLALGTGNVPLWRRP